MAWVLWRSRLGALITVAAGLAVSPAVAQTQQQIDWCVNNGNTFSADLQISGCTTSIQSGRSSGRDLAWAFANRGIAYDAKKDYDRAIADYNEAIRLDPKGLNAYYNRGTAYRAKGDIDRAIADYNEAIRLDPKDALAFSARGLAYHAKGDIDRAIADYNETIRLDPKYAVAFANRGIAYDAKKDYDRAIADYNEAIRLDPNNGNYRSRGYANFYLANYGTAATDLALVVQQQPDDTYPVLWLYLARARGGNQDAGHELETNSAKLKQADWPYPVAALFLGQKSPEETLAAAAKPDERCEAQFYIGEWHLMRNERERAVELLKAAVESCPKGFFEYSGAVAELKRLGL